MHESRYYKHSYIKAIIGAGDQIQLGTGDTYRIDRGSGNFKVFVTTEGANDLIADVSFGSRGSTTNNARTANSVDLLGEVPEGDFTIAAGESVGVFCRLVVA